ncbi:MerR family transcriptional regulator [Streptococcus uberis]|uniref:MerR family transcriptional regulator n=1 Tax=Streptococcus uberis TaxID=1349 RepID=UPI00057E7F01|nr:MULTISPECIES: MerR family transcriptional regulator [Streptococcus]HEP1571249.1 MerR family transcriptional regulator [Streptococcus suis]MTB35416.1 MerR family transcriptional regulator [Streptococcus uberis]MTB55006.1 MerR family transcriptional regulator [Streptococcus uberis]MTB56633.1 MerR family transcriptional regulator [Streptococcus uberis]MTB60468.1 MerR family transcriptional regulator [Streptococcus uberis]
MIEIEKLKTIEELLTLLVTLIQEKEAYPLGIMTQKDLLTKLNIAPNTLKSWENKGLKRLEPPIEGTRTIYYKVDDVIKFLTP